MNKRRLPKQLINKLIADKVYSNTDTSEELKQEILTDHGVRQESYQHCLVCINNTS